MASQEPTQPGTTGADDTATVREPARRRLVWIIAATVAAVAVTGVSVAAATGVWRKDEPAASPSPSVTPSPSPSASVTPSPQVPELGFAGTVTESPYLPDAQAITPEIWASAGSGWAVVTYRERWVDETWTGDSWDYSHTDGPHIAYLASPAGDRFELSTLSADADYDILWWAPGSTEATVISRTLDDDDTAPTFGSLDLATGTYTPQVQTVPAVVYAYKSLNYDETVYAAGPRVSDWVEIAFTGAPDGMLVAYPLPLGPADFGGVVEELESLGSDRYCTFSHLTSATEGIVRCYETVPDPLCLDGASCQFYRDSLYASTTTGTTGLIYENSSSDPGLTTWAVSNGRFIGEAYTPMPWGLCPLGFATMRNGQLEILFEATTYLLATSGTSAYLGVLPGCDGPLPSGMTRVDIVTGEVVELFPIPRDPGGPGWPEGGVRGTYVAP